ncbi:MAG: AraC family transcriptional regulator, partial [Oscillospiraceae bacterium]
FKNKVNNVLLKNKFMEILDEFSNKLPYYKTATKALISTFLVELCRKYVQLSPKTASKALNGKMEMVKMAVLYIKDHFKESIKIDDIAVYVGFSKYYLCREFKIITGGTIVEYINFLKCSSAKSLLASGKYTVTEVAELYGFENLSYFTKTYKKVIGRTPSETKSD